MTIDERLDKLTERHEALTQTVELVAANMLKLEANVDKLEANVDKLVSAMKQSDKMMNRLANIVIHHDERLDALDGGDR